MIPVEQKITLGKIRFFQKDNKSSESNKNMPVKLNFLVFDF